MKKLFSLLALLLTCVALAQTVDNHPVNPPVWAHVESDAVTAIKYTVAGEEYMPPDASWVDVTSVQGIGIDWVRNADGTFSAPVPTLDQRRSAVVSTMLQLRDQRLKAGFVFDGNGYDSSDAAAINYTGVTTAIYNEVPGPFDFNTITGDSVSLDAATAKKLVYAFTAYKQGVYKAARQHKQAILASDNPEEYDYTVKWPQSYADYLAAQKN